MEQPLKVMTPFASLCVQPLKTAPVGPEAMLSDTVDASVSATFP